MHTIKIRNLVGLEEMVGQFPLIQQLNPKMELSRFRSLLPRMLAKGYRMVGIFEGETCLGISGYWVGTKLYSGNYLEIDNFVVAEGHRSKQLGKRLLDWLSAEAALHQCETLMLDAYVQNHAAHKFYLREGFMIKGFHFLKSI